MLQLRQAPAELDGSGSHAVYRLLKEDGYNVSIVQNPTLSLEGDAEATRQVIDAQDGPVVLVGHSYGGALITDVLIPQIRRSSCGRHRRRPWRR